MWALNWASLKVSLKNSWGFWKESLYFDDERTPSTSMERGLFFERLIVWSPWGLVTDWAKPATAPLPSLLKQMET